MTSFSRQEGTPPIHGAWARWKRRRHNLDNQDLAQAIEARDVERVRGLLDRPDRDLEDPYRIGKAVNSFSEVWRTPLEHAVDVASPLEMIQALLRSGSRITDLAMELALDGACHSWNPPREEDELEHARCIFDALTEAGADWGSAMAAYAERRPEDQNLPRLEARRRALVATSHVPEAPAIAPRRRLRS